VAATLRQFLMSPGEEGGDASPDEEDYLSKLAKSVTGKTPFPYKERVQGGARAARTSSAEIRKPTATPPPGATPPPRMATPAPRAATPAPNPAIVRHHATPAPTEGIFAAGTILLFDDNTLGVYKEKRADKEYDVILMLNPDGAVVPQGIALLHYDVKAVGCLPPEFLLRLIRRKTWVRDEVVFHLNAFDYCQYVAEPRPGAAATPTDEPRRSPSSDQNLSQMVRKLPTNQGEEQKRLITGREITISFGPGQEWRAVYWGEDELGTVLAHRTNEQWALMHLDLRRFKDSLVLGELATAETMKQIRDEIGR